MSKTKTIDGLAVTSMSLEPADACDLLPEIAPIIGTLFSAQKAIAEQGIADALKALGQTLGGGKLTDLMVRLLSSTIITDPNGTKFRITDRATFNLAFGGRMWSAFAVAAFAFEVTYGNFSDVASRLPGGNPVQAAAQ